MNTLFDPIASLRPLRPRQTVAIEAIRQAVKEGHKRIVVQAPTGFGKTLTAAHLIYGSVQKGRRPIFTCPAITLVDQTLKAFEAEGLSDIGIIQAQHERTDWAAQVQIASVHTLIRRALPEVDLILIDECHENFDGLNDRLDSEEWKEKIAIGLSATPWAKGMGLRWTKLVIAATTKELIDEGFLSPSVVYVPASGLDRKKLKVDKGEFQEKSASLAMSDSKIVGDIVAEWQEKGCYKTFMFCVDRNHAKEQMDAFLDTGIPFGYIDALTPMNERTRLFERMGYGEIAGIASVGCLIRGVDEDVRCLIDAQPTKSLIRHVQKWGRGIRTADGKERLIGLDHAGNNMALGFFEDIHFDRLDTRKPSDKGEAYAEDKKPAKPRKCGKCGALVPAGKGFCVCGEKLAYQSRVESVDGELVEMGSGKKAKEDKYSMTDKQEFYSGFLGLAAERGRNPGWAAHRYKEKFGVWPRGLIDLPSTPTRRVQDFDRHCRIKFAKSKEAERGTPLHQVNSSS